MKKIAFIFLLLMTTLPVFADFTTGESAFKNQDYSTAFDELLPLANEGDYRAQYYIGYIYLYGYGVGQNPELAVEYLTQSADQGYEVAISFLAYLYAQGNIIEKDMPKAIALYEKAGEENNISANLNLGLIYYQGDGIQKNYEKALTYLQKIPIKDHPKVGRYLGDIYLSYHKVKDPVKALYYYQVAAQSGDLEALFDLAQLYKEGTKIDQNIDKAVEYHTYAASQNFAASQYILGLMYANGEGIAQNMGLAYAWLSFASEQGLSVAMMPLRQISSKMGATELDKARQEVIRIQQTVIKKLPFPHIMDDRIANMMDDQNDNKEVSAGISRSATSATIAKPRRTLKKRRR